MHDIYTTVRYTISYDQPLCWHFLWKPLCFLVYGFLMLFLLHARFRFIFSARMSPSWFVKQLFNCFIHYFLEFSYEFQSVSSSSGFQWVSSSSDSSGSLSWSWAGSSATSHCHTFPVHLVASPVTSHLSVDRHHRTCPHVLGGISSTLLSSVTAPVTSLTLCASGVSPVSFLTVLTSLPNAIVSSFTSSCSQPSVVFLHVATCLVIFLDMMPLIGLSPMPLPYFRICPRSPIDLLLTCFPSLLQCLLLGCPFSI